MGAHDNMLVPFDDDDFEMFSGADEGALKWESPPKDAPLKPADELLLIIFGGRIELRWSVGENHFQTLIILDMNEEGLTPKRKRELENKTKVIAEDVINHPNPVTRLLELGGEIDFDNSSR